MSHDPDDVTGSVEYALRCVVDAASAERRLRKGEDLNETDQALLEKARQATATTIAVDDFDEDDFGGAPWRLETANMSTRGGPTT